MNPPRDVGAVWARRQHSTRLRLWVVIYAVDTELNLWGYTIENRERDPLARSVQPRVGVPGITFTQLQRQLELLVGVKVEQRPGRGLIRGDHELSVGVRTIDSSGELGFRSDVL